MTDTAARPYDWEHYRRDSAPRSANRVILSEVLIQHAILSWGMKGDDIGRIQG